MSMLLVFLLFSGASSMMRVLLSAPLCLHIWLSSCFTCWPEIWIAPSDHDLTQQLWFVRASLATLPIGADRAKWSAYHLTEPQTLADRERLLAAARAVGDRLEALALRGVDSVSWIGLTHTHKRRWSIVPLGIDFYDGLPGVALFLAYLGAITQDERYTALAQDVSTTMRR
jgi:class II lanthipeptide synthase